MRKFAGLVKMQPARKRVIHIENKSMRARTRLTLKEK